MSNVYNAPCHMAGASDFICGTCICIHSPYMPTKYVAYMSTFLGLFVFGTYLAITCQVDYALSCVSAYMCKNVRFICPLTLKFVLTHCQQAHSHLHIHYSILSDAHPDTDHSH